MALAQRREVIVERYYFDVKDGAHHIDAEGSEWPDLHAVRIEAIRLSGEILKEMPESFWHAQQWQMSVSNRHRTLVFTLRFSAEDAPAARPATRPVDPPADQG